MDEQLYDIQGLAERLRCSPATAYKMVRSNDIRCARVGNRYRIPKSAVEEFLRGGGSGEKSGESEHTETT
jgi:excisionase family DNA binding protein